MILKNYLYLFVSDKMQTPFRAFRFYTTAAPAINRYSRSEENQRENITPIRLFSDDDDNLIQAPSLSSFPPIDSRYVLRRVDDRIDYSLCVDTDDEKTCV